jgi:uncharacterized membrane protein
MHEKAMQPISTFEDLVLVFGLALAALIVASVPVLNATVARPIIGAIAILFVPGYAFIAALFPQKTTLRNGVRLALSFGLSIVIVPLLEIALNYTRWGIQLGPTLIVIVVFTLLCSIVASVRRYRLPRERRFAINWPDWHHIRLKAARLGGTRFDRTLSVVLIIAIITSVAVTSYAVVMPKPNEHFTEFYLLGTNGTLGNYTTQYKVGVPTPVTVVIVNHEQTDVTYDLVVTANNSTQREIIYSEQVMIPSGQQWEKSIDLVLDHPSDNALLDFALYANQTTTNPYRDVHVWVNVTA